MANSDKDDLAAPLLRDDLDRALRETIARVAKLHAAVVDRNFTLTFSRSSISRRAKSITSRRSLVSTTAHRPVTPSPSRRPSALSPILTSPSWDR